MTSQQTAPQGEYKASVSAVSVQEIGKNKLLACVLQLTLEAQRQGDDGWHPCVGLFYAIRAVEFLQKRDGSRNAMAFKILQRALRLTEVTPETLAAVPIGTPLRIDLEHETVGDRVYTRVKRLRPPSDDTGITSPDVAARFAALCGQPRQARMDEPVAVPRPAIVDEVPF